MVYWRLLLWITCRLKQERHPRVHFLPNLHNDKQVLSFVNAVHFDVLLLLVLLNLCYFYSWYQKNSKFFRHHVGKGMLPLLISHRPCGVVCTGEQNMFKWIKIRKGMVVTQILIWQKRKEVLDILSVSLVHNEPNVAPRSFSCRCSLYVRSSYQC